MAASGKRLPPGRNLLRNGDFLIAQRGDGPFTAATSPVNNDDTYLLDGWILLADGADTADVSRVATDLPSGARGKLRLDVETANRKFGVLQIVEQAEALEIIGGTASLSFKARGVSAGALSINNIRAGVLAWSSTADSVTSDVVSAWGASGADPTLATNWTYENTPANLALSTAWQEYRVSGVSIDTASAANVGVFIWVDDTDAAVGDFLEITDVKLEAGSSCTPFDRQPKAAELARCLPYFERLGGTSTTEALGIGMCTATTTAEVDIWFSPKRAAPSGAFTTASNYATNAGSPSSLSLTKAGKASAAVSVTMGSAVFTVGNATFLQANSTLSGVIDLSAEL